MCQAHLRGFEVFAERCIKQTCLSVWLIAVGAASCLMLVASSTWAETKKTYIVQNDRGGYLHDRIIELENLRRNEVRIEIRGRVCYSTCTMFLGLPDTCVDAKTVFGFHGPSRSGRRLPQKDFDYFSQIMADHYPEPLKTWFMLKGRNRIAGIHRIRGAELIQMGIPACRAA